MARNNHKEEDTAAVLMGKTKCPGCLGTGRQKSGWSAHYTRKCEFCDGTRWVKYNLGDIFYDNKDYTAWVYDGDNWVKVGTHEKRFP